jgi:hypothetical protein
MRRGCLSCRRKRFKISLEVAALDVAAPFTVVLNGDATILTSVVVDELIAEVVHHNAQQYARLVRHTSRWWCARSRGEHERAAAGSCCPPSLCGVLVVVMTS